MSAMGIRLAIALAKIRNSAYLPPHWAALSPAALTGVRLLRAATRAYTTSVGPPVNHADPPHFATSLGVRPPPPLL
jgi:hypothetical protein